MLYCSAPTDLTSWLLLWPTLSHGFGTDFSANVSRTLDNLLAGSHYDKRIRPGMGGEITHGSRTGSEATIVFLMSSRFYSILFKGFGLKWFNPDKLKAIINC